MDPATAAFNDSTSPFPGIDQQTSHNSRTATLAPCDSDPTTIASGNDLLS